MKTACSGMIQIELAKHAALPTIKQGAHPIELEFPIEDVDLRKDLHYAVNVALPPSLRDTEENTKENKSKFYRLKLLPEQYRYTEYYYPENEPYRVFFHNVCNRWFVYKTYQRVDELFLTDNFNAKSYYMGMIPDTLMQRGDFREINDFLSVACVLHGENERKKELQFRTGRGFRLSARTMKGRKLPATYLASHAREGRTGPTMLKLVVYRHAVDIANYQEGRLKKINEESKNVDIYAHLTKFAGDHAAWLKVRRGMLDYEALQHRIRKTVPFKRSAATRLVILPGLTVADLCNELIDFPAWTGYHYYYMRVCNKKGVNIVYDDINYAVLNTVGMILPTQPFQKENNKLRHLRVKLSRYSYSPQAVAVFDSQKVFSGGKLILDNYPLKNRPPSVASESGVSTITKMSTATTVSCRGSFVRRNLCENDIKHFKRGNAAPLSISFNEEMAFEGIDCSYDRNDMDTVATTLNLNSRMDPRVVCACEFQSPSRMLEEIGDLKWLHDAEKRIDEIVTKPNPTADDRKDLQVLLYAKQRYEQPLSIYDQSTLQSIDVAQEKPQTVTDRHSWVLDSDYSNITLVSRADKLCKTRVADFFHRFHLTDRQANFLAIGTFLLFLFLFILFCTIVMLKPQSVEDADIGYCPASVFGFDTDDPKQVATMRESYDIKMATHFVSPRTRSGYFFWPSGDLRSQGSWISRILVFSDLGPLIGF
ncbi:unnamed protein product [Anisakis simplex]|uniref:Tudor domain-containing protein n=1 Tax=Anisakis simplex TaxID=6269 RepID=A0A0M3JSI7_ANISI|nr:unnamed protein product [Anisakis simplex]